MAISGRTENTVTSRELVLSIIDFCEYALEPRIHNIAYLAELAFAQRHSNYRMTNIQYKPYFNGVYSDSIHGILIDEARKENVDTGKMTIDGRQETVYYGTFDVDLPEDVLDVLSDTCRKYQSIGIEELVEIVHKTPLYHTADFDANIDFNSYDGELELFETP